jgi:hypothetical protein
MGGELRHSNKSHIRARLVSEFVDRLVFRTELDVSEIGWFLPQANVWRSNLLQLGAGSGMSCSYLLDNVTSVFKFNIHRSVLIWCWNLDASGSRSETPGKFWNVVLEKDGKDQLDWSCDKWRSIRVKEERNILHEIIKRKANWIGHILRRNCLLQRVIEGKIKGGIEVTGRRGRRRRKLLADLKERRGYSNLKEEALDRTMWRARFGRGCGPVVRQTTKWMKVRAS